MVKLTEAEKTRQYLLLVTAGAVRALLGDPKHVDYTIDRLQRVADRADEMGQPEIAIIARGELDVAKRQKSEIVPRQPVTTVWLDCPRHGKQLFSTECYECTIEELCALCGKMRKKHQAVGVFNDEPYCPDDSKDGQRFSTTQWFREA